MVLNSSSIPSIVYNPYEYKFACTYPSSTDSQYETTCHRLSIYFYSIQKFILFPPRPPQPSVTIVNRSNLMKLKRNVIAFRVDTIDNVNCDKWKWKKIANCVQFRRQIFYLVRISKIKRKRLNGGSKVAVELVLIRKHHFELRSRVSLRRRSPRGNIF